MKKVFALIAIVGLVSCGGEAKVETPATADSTVTPAVDTTAPVAPTVDTTAKAAPVAAPASH